MLKSRVVILLVGCFVFAAIPTGAGAAGYVLDDGTADLIIGPGSSQYGFVWGNHFTRSPGSEVITEISAAFGQYTPNFNGSLVIGSLWSDPNGDGIPDDALQLASVIGTIANWGTDIFNTFDISDTLVTNSFFVVFDFPAQALFPDTSYFVGRFDTNSGGPYRAGWVGVDVAFTGTGQMGYGFDPIEYNGAFLIRAEGTPAVPEPSTMLLVGSGLVGLVGYGRRRFKK